MKFCPECGAKLVTQKFCQECGANISKYLNPSETSSMASLDFSALEQAAQKQLDEQSGLEMQGTVLVKYTGKSADVVIPWGIAEIYDGAFQNNRTVTTVQIPEGVKRIGKSAFQGCTYLKSVTLPSTLEEIHPYAFRDCRELEHITIPDQVTLIRDYVFSGCSKLKSVTIPRSLTQIWGGAFDQCHSLTDIYITDIAAWCAISGLQVLMDATKSSKTLHIHNKAIDELVIPDSVTAIADYAFSNCIGITSIALHGGITRIGNHAFFSCGLREVTIPPSVTGIGYSAFASCQNLTRATVSANLPDSNNSGVFSNCKNLAHVIITKPVKHIGTYAFFGCAALAHVSIPNSVTSIGNYAFSECTALSDIALPNSLATIGCYAFSSCSNLTRVQIPNSVTSIEGGAFYNCTGLTELTLPFVGQSRTAQGANGVLGHIFGFTTSRDSRSGAIEQYQKAENSWGQTHYTCYYYYIPSSLRSVTVTDAATISDQAFYGCRQLTSITLSNTVTSIGGSAFAHCAGLRSFTIPESVTSIGNAAFWNCAGFSSITIPASVRTIGAGALNCEGWSYNDRFTSISVSEYNPSYQSVNGVLYSKDGTQLIKYPCGKTDTSFTVPSSVVSIAEGALKTCANLINLVIPNSVGSIAPGTLEGCSKLVNLTIPFIGSKRTTLSKGDRFGIIFSSCNDERGVPASLKNVTVTGGTHVPDDAFSACRNISSITLPDGITYIGSDAFFWCSNLTRVNIPSSVTTIRWEAFCGCQSLHELSIPASVRTIDRNLFTNCTSMTVRTSEWIAKQINTAGSASIRFITW